MSEMREWTRRIGDAFLLATNAQRVVAAVPSVAGGLLLGAEGTVFLGVLAAFAGWTILQSAFGYWRPPFVLSEAPGDNGWVKLLLTNKSVAGEFWVDVVEVDGAAHAPIDEWAVRWVGGTKRYRLVRGESHELEVGQVCAPNLEDVFAVLTSVSTGSGYRLLVPVAAGPSHEVEFLGVTPGSHRPPLVLTLQIGKDTGQKKTAHLDISLTNGKFVHSVR